ncbi:ATP-binding protein [Litorilituus lipolyticus]|uniref:histidine kinase n=1 Tax=Litorilituus lipolyticus TaxID=2491017 RepID=A0A502KQS2_9GAMM|nr:ATP-binding protein [Litorilituus lipolyticus]TPH13912.1 two-component sensor histidine kinase [Litorilituus lipolyticus]
MKFQFARLYLLIVLIASLVIFSFSEIYNNFFQDDMSYQIDIKQILPYYTQSRGSIPYDNVKLKVVTAKSIIMPKHLSQLLAQGQIIKIADETGYEFYYQYLDKNNLYQFGPVLTKKANEDNGELYFVLLFYSALALLVLGFIWPLFKDLAKLQTKALTFGEKLQPISSDISRSSNIYPLANTFDKMSHQIVETMQMHQDLSRTIAHEIRTPLARMKFVSELISDDIDVEHQKRLKADVDEIEQLMAEYLSFERLEHEHYSMDKKLENVTQFFNSLNEKYLYQKGSISIDFSSNTTHAYFNRKGMDRAIQNLINNALRYANTVIEVNFIVKDQMCFIVVADDGTGVGKEAKKLIQPFIRKNSKDNNDTGYGLGLYIVRKILIWHQGKLSLGNCSELKGAKVTLSWPNQN